MRNAFNLVVCTLALVSAGPLAALESKSLSPLPDPLSARFEQAVQLLRGNPATGVKTQLGTAADAGGRSLTRTQATPTNTEQGRGDYVMLLAGVMIMGVIVRRRYGRGD